MSQPPEETELEGVYQRANLDELALQNGAFAMQFINSLGEGEFDDAMGRLYNRQSGRAGYGKRNTFARQVELYDAKHGLDVARNDAPEAMRSFRVAAKTGAFQHDDCWISELISGMENMLETGIVDDGQLSYLLRTCHIYIDWATNGSSLPNLVEMEERLDNPQTLEITSWSKFLGAMEQYYPEVVGQGCIAELEEKLRHGDFKWIKTTLEIFVDKPAPWQVAVDMEEP
ncbi:hypothetical protein B0T16DRAFT_459204 [Cercophora newfieldiana]|uniref:Uncharacterized protein n=1 Tax=Cercophora newfieldiana TaxID=92897 RepID=A0AA40CLL2_9PEZI|nr:hypothetical protein B0T16DRAFT_459204 [Cercophora newfieldiana]